MTPVTPNTSILLIMQKSWEQEVVDEIIALEKKEARLLHEIEFAEEWLQENYPRGLYPPGAQQALEEMESELADVRRLLKS